MDQQVEQAEPIAPTRPQRTRGFRSLALLLGLGSVAAISGLVVANSSEKRTDPAPSIAAVSEPVRPGLAATFFTATDMQPAVNLAHSSDTLRRRETLSDLIERLGANRQDTFQALQPLLQDDMLDARRLRPGLQADAWFDADGSLNAISVKESADKSFLVTRSQGDAWTATRLTARMTPTYTRIAAPIETSIYETALRLGAKDQQVVDFADAFAYDVDFQREIHPGDSFEIVFESFVDERGNLVKGGEVIYAELDGQALKRGFYRFTPSDDGVSDYFDTKGESATKFLMKTPINGARLSSSFGKRRHPISGYTRLHKGTDFAAPTGTPIYAAGHGTVERASRYGGYGKYVRIKHKNGYKTAYAHMSRYGRGIRAGKQVRQGDVIGYVGSTGASTGPHLHYEVYINGTPVNAMRLKLPTGRKLAETPEMLAEFVKRKSEIDAIRVDQGAVIETAAMQVSQQKLP